MGNANARTAFGPSVIGHNLSNIVGSFCKPVRNPHQTATHLILASFKFEATDDRMPLHTDEWLVDLVSRPASVTSHHIHLGRQALTNLSSQLPPASIVHGRGEEKTNCTLAHGRGLVSALGQRAPSAKNKFSFRGKK